MKLFVHNHKQTGVVVNNNLDKADRQITYILAVQALLPAISLMVHTLVLSATLIYPGESLYFLLYVTLPIYWIPVLQPLSTIFIVRSYRKFFYENSHQQSVEDFREITAYFFHRYFQSLKVEIIIGGVLEQTTWDVFRLRKINDRIIPLHAASAQLNIATYCPSILAALSPVI
uniref:Uncharacterized protein n=1 Tax=Ditylenchus dipsaci TaxID=166011 RepID=A0A915D0Q5_9BILA